MRTSRLFLLGLAAGCGSGVGSHDEAADETLKAMQEFATILEGVKDKATAAAARPRIEALGKRLDEIRKGIEELGEPTEEESKRVLEKMQRGIGGLYGRMDMITARLDAGSAEVAMSLQAPAAEVMGKFMALRGMLGG